MIREVLGCGYLQFILLYCCLNVRMFQCSNDLKVAVVVKTFDLNTKRNKKYCGYQNKANFNAIVRDRAVEQKFKGNSCTCVL